MLKDQSFYAGFPGVCRTPLSAIFGSSELKDSHSPRPEFPYFTVKSWKMASVGLASP